MTTVKFGITDNDSVDSTHSINFDVDYLAISAFEKEVTNERWNEIEGKLISDWGLNLNTEDEDGLVSPSGEAISQAFRLVKYMRQRDWRLPTGVIADGDGGIVFENRHDPLYQTVEIDASGQISFFTYKDCNLLSQRPIEFLS